MISSDGIPSNEVSDRSYLSNYSDTNLYEFDRKGQSPLIVPIMLRYELLGDRIRQLLDAYRYTSSLRKFHRSEEESSRSMVESNDVMNRYSIFAGLVICLLTVPLSLNHSFLPFLPIVIPILIPLYQSWNDFLLRRMPEGIDDRLCLGGSSNYGRVFQDQWREYKDTYLRYVLSMYTFNLLTFTMVMVPLFLDGYLDLTLPALLYKVVYGLFGNLVLVHYITPLIYLGLILVLNRCLVSILRLWLLRKRLKATEVICRNLNEELAEIEARELTWNYTCKLLPLELQSYLQYDPEPMMTLEESRVYSSKVDRVYTRQYYDHLFLKQNQLIQRNFRDIKCNFTDIVEGSKGSDRYPFRPSAHYGIMHELMIPTRSRWNNTNRLGLIYVFTILVYMLTIHSIGPFDAVLNLLPIDSSGLFDYFRS